MTISLQNEKQSGNRSLKRTRKALHKQLTNLGIPESIIHTEGPAYDRSISLWNSAVLTRPAVVVHCATALHVQAAVLAAVTLDIPLAVRSGGHDWAGRALIEDGLVLDVRSMSDVTIDVNTQSATVSAGATALSVVEAAERHGLVAAAGGVGSIGYAGLVLGGGNGPLNGRIGLAADNLISAEVVLADGSIVTADETHEPELFWALRGGGGNFGVVVEMRVRLHPVPAVTSGAVIFPAADANQVLAGWAEMMATASDDLNLGAMAMTTPHGPVVAITPTLTGNTSNTNTELGAIRALGRPVAVEVHPTSYADILRTGDKEAGARSARQVWGRSFRSYPLDAVQALAEGARTLRGRSLLIISHVNGVAARIDPPATAFGFRGPRSDVEIIADLEDNVEGGRRWGADLDATLAPLALSASYANLLPHRSPLAEHAYGPNASRLLAAKRHYDPDGRFRSMPLPTREPAREL